MADTFHFSVSIISRGKGKSAVASAAYISGEKIKNEYDGLTHDYTKKHGVIDKNIMLPDHIPKDLESKFKDRRELWNSVEMYEKNSNAQLVRQFIIALPKELSLEENKRLLEEFIKENLTNEGMIADYAIHDESREENQNIHAHILTIVRPINEKGEWQQKSKKEYITDKNGEKILNKNGKPKTRKIELTNWNDKGNVEKWRESFSNICNKYLEENNIEKRVDHRSFERQGIKQIPTIHLGSSASAMEKKGIRTEKGDINREIKKQNNLLKSIADEIKKITSWIGSFKNKLTQAYSNYKEELVIEKENKSSLFNLYEYLIFYDEMRNKKRQGLNFYASRNKAAYDLKKFSNAVLYLRNNDIKTIAQLQSHIDKLKATNNKIYKDINSKTKEIDKLNKCFGYVEVVKRTKPIFDEYKSKKLFKEKFYKDHQTEIDQSIRARANIEKLSGSPLLKPKEWTAKINQLEKEIADLNNQSQEIKDKYQDINHIKYAVEVVNEEYGIDLSIEIDKAIKRGEKESIIKQIEKYKAQEESYKKHRENKKEQKINRNQEL